MSKAFKRLSAALVRSRVPHTPEALRTLLTFYVVLGACLALVLSRNWSGWGGVPVVGPLHLNDHFSNAALSCMLLSSWGASTLLGAPMRWRQFAWFALALVLANLGVELVNMGELNVADLRDAASGVVGVAAGIGVTRLMVRLSGSGSPQPSRSELP